MIAQLRRRHLFIWMLIAPIILTGAVVAFLEAPTFPIGNYGEKNPAFPELTNSIVSNNYMFNLKKNYSGGTVLEILQISDINPAIELVSIQFSKKGSNKKSNQNLGLMGGDKLYYFNLGALEPPFTVIVKDTIKQIILAKIDF